LFTILSNHDLFSYEEVILFVEGLKSKVESHPNHPNNMDFRPSTLNFRLYILIC
jgi:hypothetical protein